MYKINKFVVLVSDQLINVIEYEDIAHMDNKLS